MLLEILKNLECSLHDDKRNDREWLEQILHEEFREITRSCMLFDRSETIEVLSTEDNSPIIHSGEFRLIIVRNNFAILHYRTFDPDGSNASHRSSCWEMSRNGQWQLVFHQGTPESKRVQMQDEDATSVPRSKRTFHSHLLACRISFTLPYDESAQIRLLEFSDLRGG